MCCLRTHFGTGMKLPFSRRWLAASVTYLTEAPLDLVRLVARVHSPGHGGIASFLGVVRSHHQGRTVVRLTYSAYPEMAEAECARIVADAETRWPVRVALEHRLGTLEIGEAAVAVVAAGAHRDEAFAACRHVIEELKSRVPIWKREQFADGGHDWVGQDASAPEAG
jgi:molybdopterin synthase catalytic subunit